MAEYIGGLFAREIQPNAQWKNIELSKKWIYYYFLQLLVEKVDVTKTKLLKDCTKKKKKSNFGVVFAFKIMRFICSFCAYKNFCDFHVAEPGNPNYLSQQLKTNKQKHLRLLKTLPEQQVTGDQTGRQEQKVW